MDLDGLNFGYCFVEDLFVAQLSTVEVVSIHIACFQRARAGATIALVLKSVVHALVRSRPKRRATRARRHVRDVCHGIKLRTSSNESHNSVSRDMVVWTLQQACSCEDFVFYLANLAIVVRTKQVRRDPGLPDVIIWVCSWLRAVF